MQQYSALCVEKNISNIYDSACMHGGVNSEAGAINIIIIRVCMVHGINCRIYTCLYEHVMHLHVCTVNHGLI